MDTLTDVQTKDLRSTARWVELGNWGVAISETGGGYTAQSCHSARPTDQVASISNSDWQWSCGVSGGSLPKHASLAGQPNEWHSIGHYAGGYSADGFVGFSTWSSQRSAVAAIEGRISVDGLTFSAGISRIDVKMRCGNVLPFAFRVGFFGDLSLDRKVDATDVIVWNRRQFPEARNIYKTHLVWKLGVSYHSCRPKEWVDKGYAPPVITFSETLEWIRDMSLISGGMPQIVYLVGWQGTGHDTLYPSLDVLNEALGTKEDLERLAKNAMDLYDTIISYHINTDEAYSNYSEYKRAADGALTFVQGISNTDVNMKMLARNPDGSGYEWAPSHNLMAYSTAQGPAYHVSKTKDVVSGQRIKRLAKIFDTIPVNSSLHCDAWRDINLSYENETEDDPWGWILENEEMKCGCEPEKELYERHGVSFGVEGPNGMSSDVRGLVDYYWHVGDPFWVFGKIVGGGCNGDASSGCCHSGCSIDGDVTAGCTAAHGPTSDCTAPHCKGNSTHAAVKCSFEHGECCPFFRRSPQDWYVIADDVYLKTRVFQVFLTDELVDPAGRFKNNGTLTTWPLEPLLSSHQVTIRNGTGVFLPAIKLPNGADPRARATIDVLEKDFAIAVYEQACTYRQIPGLSIPTCPSRDGPPKPAIGRTWALPVSWHDKDLQATTITPSGTKAGPALVVDKAAGTVTLSVTPGWPVTLTLKTVSSGRLKMDDPHTATPSAAVRRPPSYWCTWAAQGRRMFDTAGASTEEAERLWKVWRVKKNITWSDRAFLNESVLFDNISRGGSLGELTGMAYNWPLNVRSELVLMLDNAWAASKFDDGRYPTSPLQLDVAHRFPSFAAPTPTLALKKLVEKVKALGWYGLGVWSGSSLSPADLSMLGKAGVTMLKYDHSDSGAHMTALARSAAPELWVTQHGVSQDFVPLSSSPNDGAPDRYPVANAEVDARTLNVSDIFTTYDFVYALSVPEALDRHWKILNASSQLGGVSAATPAPTCVAESGVCYSHPPSMKRIRSGPPAHNASGCCAACGDDARCAAWVFRPPTAPTNAGCLLKPQGSVTKRMDPLCTSGLNSGPRPVATYSRLIGSSGVTMVTGALGGLVEPMDSNIRGLGISKAFDVYVDGPPQRQRQRREDELGRLLRWATVAPPFGAGIGQIEASEEILFDEWRFGLRDDACTIRRNITNRTIRSGAPARISRGGLPLPVVSRESAPFEPTQRKPYTVLTKFPDGTSTSALTALVTTLGRTSVSGWTEDAADVSVDLSSVLGKPVTLGALGNMLSLSLKLGDSNTLAPRVHALDMIAIGTTQEPSDITLNTTWSHGALTVPGKLLGSLGTAKRSRADDVSAPGTVLYITWKTGKTVGNDSLVVKTDDPGR